MRSFQGAFGAGLLALVAAAGASQESAKPAKPAVRHAIEALEAHLDRAVDRVSLPHAARLLGRAESARGYRLPGYGVVLVLTPRALPGEAGRVYFLQGGGPNARRKLRVEAKPAGEPATVVVDATEDEGVLTFERQVLVLQRETEAARLAAEEELERIVRDVRVRIAPVADAAAAQAPPGAPAPPTPPTLPAPPAPPPWKFWFEAGTPSETRAPEAVVADVRTSLVEALMAPGGDVAGLVGHERLTVAVDFVPGGLFAANARPRRTLVVSVRARDLSARARGSITQDELRGRVEVNEY